MKIKTNFLVVHISWQEPGKLDSLFGDRFVLLYAPLGYGFSIMDEPRPDEKFDIESFGEMFTDWAGHAARP